MIRFTVPGPPQGKGRPRFSTFGGRARAFTPTKTVAYEGLIALAAQDVMAGAPPLDGPVKVTAFATFAVPQSWSKKRKAEASYHTGKPDADNIAKAIGDGLNGVVWRDDSQIAVCTVFKSYGPVPGLTVEVVPLASEVLRPPLGSVG